MAKFDYRCPQCGMIYVLEARIGCPPEQEWTFCQLCPGHIHLERYLGQQVPYLGLGFQESKHGDIEKFQFTHLK